jgi:hypothetical protein
MASPDAMATDATAVGRNRTRGTSQIPFASRAEGQKFHKDQSQSGFDGIAKVDKLSPYLESDHYEAIRNYSRSIGRPGCG